MRAWQEHDDDNKEPRERAEQEQRSNASMRMDPFQCCHPEGQAEPSSGRAGYLSQKRVFVQLFQFSSSETTSNAMRSQQVLDEDIVRARELSHHERSPDQKQDDMNAYLLNAAIKTAPHYKEYLAYVRDACGEDDYEVALPGCDPVMEIIDFQSYVLKGFGVDWQPAEVLSRAIGQTVQTRQTQEDKAGLAESC